MINTQQHFNTERRPVFCRYPDVVLATLLCIRANLCRRRFEIKVNDMVFVGFPMQMPAAAAGTTSSTHTSPNTCCSQPQVVHPSPKREQSSTVSYNIVFAVKVTSFEFFLSISWGFLFSSMRGR